MAFTDHFRLYLNYGGNSYYRVTKENRKKLEELKRSLISKAKNKQLIAESEINQFLSLFINIEDEEFKHYISEADLSTTYIIEYFEKQEDYIWQELVTYKGDEVDYFDGSQNKFITTNLEETSDEGFEFMIFTILHEYLKNDKGRKPPVNRDRCIMELILALLKYRRDTMKPEIKPLYTIYRVLVVAAVIADMVFNLLPEPQPDDMLYNNEEYHYFAQKGCEMAKVAEPDLFIGLPE